MEVSTSAMASSFEAGHQRADEIYAHRQTVEAFATRQPFGGHLILEGDSWFDYPLYDELTEKLRDEFNYKVYSAARFGDTAENMAYNDGGQGDRLAEPFERIRDAGQKPRAILLSCGGNDFVDAFGVCLEHKATNPADPLNGEVVGVVMNRLAMAVAHLAGVVKGLGRSYFGTDVPVVVHGYGNPIADGRGFKAAFIELRGPWLEPWFEAKGYPRSDLAERREIMTRLIRIFNEDVLEPVASSLENVHYVDVRGALSNDLPDAYSESWDNEIHPTSEGFTEVARLLDERIRALPMP